ncbi:Nucleoporin p58/p45 [Geodia barretti]|uniref:Nucleoporin p58/p45 n=1 Tax=Geodia barretti TaxID=519541 RepID=A0AA35RI52_GEOBA|nr:Nucleoporin p58/p45 [Geodia barretti]
MNFNLGQQKGGLSLGGGLQLGVLGQQQQQLGGLSGGAGLGLGLGATQQQTAGLGTGLKLGMPTAAVAPQPSASGGLSASSGLQLGSGQTGGLYGQARGLQLGSGQAGGLQLGSGQTGGLQLGSGQLKLGQTNQQKGLQLGGGLTGGLQLGATQTGGGGLQLGAAAHGLQAGGGLQLGAAQSGGGGLQLGVTATQTKGLQLGGATTAATQNKGLQLAGGGGLQLGVGTTGTTQSRGLGLGGTSLAAGLQTTTPGLGGLGAQNRGIQLGGLPTATTLGSLGGGGVKAGLPGMLGGGLPTTAASSSFRGLGGVDPNAGKPGAGDGSSTPVMEQPLPPVLNQLVHQFSQHMKQQSTTGDEMDKFSDSDMKKVQQETGTQREVVGELLAQVQRDAQRVSYLKGENTKELRHVEIAQRTQELPATLQHENTAPAHYFQSVVAVFEEKMELYRNQLVELESHLSAVGRDHSVSPQNLVDILQVQYKPFLLLAAQLQTIHEQVQILREQYLAYRRVFLQDSTDVFEDRRRRREAESERGKVKTGPPPFSAAMGQATTALAAFSTGPGLTGGVGTGLGLRGGMGGGLGGLTGFGGGIGGSGGLGTGGLGTGGLGQQNRGLTLGGGLGGMAASQPSLTGAGTGQPFQLQRPPLGKKRGTVTT